MIIYNAFRAVLDFLQSAFDYLRGIVVDSYKIFSELPTIFTSVRSVINTLPSIFITVGMFCLTVRTLVLIIHAKAGE